MTSVSPIGKKTTLSKIRVNFPGMSHVAVYPTVLPDERPQCPPQFQGEHPFFQGR